MTFTSGLGQIRTSFDYDSKLFDCLEKAKARGFLDSLEVADIRISEPDDPQRANQEKSIIQDITKLYRNLLMPGRTGEQAAAFREQIGILETQLDRLRRELRGSSLRFSGFRYPHIATLAEAQKSLPDSGTVYLAFLIGNENSYGFALSSKTFKLFPLPPRSELKTRVESFVRAASDKDRRDFEPGKVLFRELMEPALTPETRSLIIIPDDFLFYLPFESLPASAAGRDWLIERYAVQYAPSVSSLLAIGTREGKPEGSFADGSFRDRGAGRRTTRRRGEHGNRKFAQLYPLRRAPSPVAVWAGEINGIAAFFPAARKTTLLGKNADEEA